MGLARRLELQTPRGDAVRVRHPSGERDWLLQIFPVDQRMAGAAVIFILSSEDTSAPTESDLAGLFGLSPMQTRIALRLFEGQESGEIGEKLGITRNTLNTHLRRLFMKLGVSRQTELMRLFVRVKRRK